MSKNNTGAGAKNSGAAASSSDLNIPTLGQTSPASPPILQEGETPDAIAGAVDGSHEQANTGLIRNLADVQREADAAASGQARNRPAVLRQDREQFSEAGTIRMEMPITGSLDAMRRNDQYIEPVSDLLNFEDKAAQLAFFEEMMIIRIHETGDPNAENPVVLGVNGRQVAIRRGEDTIVRRKYVEMLLRAKPETVTANGDERDRFGNPKNVITKTRALKYPFSIVRDDNPKGRAWERKSRMEA